MIDQILAETSAWVRTKALKMSDIYALLGGRMFNLFAPEDIVRAHPTKSKELLI